METTIKVDGMTCGHCQKAVENALSELTGVRVVKVHLDKGEVDVTFDDSKLSLTNLKDAIEEQGYDAD